jgi:hypothetical protein
LSLLVLDSSIAFDLERGGMIEATFELDHAFLTPDLLYANELEDGPGPYMRGLGMQVVDLTAAEVGLAQQIGTKNRRVSTPDCWALVTAMRSEHRLLTGDAQLRSLAESKQIPCSGLLWLMDAIFTAGLRTPTALIEALTRTCQHARCRLPKGEVNTRLNKWRTEESKLNMNKGPVAPR